MHLRHNHLWVKRICLISIHIVIVFFSSSSAAQRHPVAFEHISVEQGLSQVTIYCILQDRKGFIWFGTEDGLNRYDGYTFRVYKHNAEDPKSLGGNAIRALHEDSSGMIWVGSDGGGLNKFDPNTEQFTRYQHDPDDPHSLSNNTVWEIYEDRDGVLWLGTYWGGGLHKFDLRSVQGEAGQFTRYDPNPDDPDSLWMGEGINVIYEDTQGLLWIGTAGGGLNLFDRKTETFTHYVHDPSDPQSLGHNTITAMYEDHLGTLWLATYGGGLNRFDRNTGQFIRYTHDPANPRSVGEDNILAIYVDSTGEFWLGMDSTGLDTFDRDTEQFAHYLSDSADPGSLSGRAIQSIYEDRAGVLWFGSQLNGLSKVDRAARKFDVYRADPENPQRLSSNDIKSICEGREGVVWISAGGRLNKLDRKTGQITRYLHPETNVGDWGIMALHTDRTGVLWLGTWGGGLRKFDPETNQATVYLTDPEDLQTWTANVVMTVYETRSEEIWISTFNGLALFDRETEQFTWYRHDPDDPHSLSHNLVLAMYEDQAGTLWLGTRDGGLNKFDRNTGQFTRYLHDPDNPQSLSHNTVVAIHEDQHGNLWIGTSDGLNKFDRTTETFLRYTEKDGLPNNSIAGLLEDDASPDGGGGNLWISTTRGLAKFDPRSNTFRNYDIRDGLQSYEFNRSAICKTRDGDMFFGGVNGLNVFSPAEVTDNPYIPPIILADFRILNESVQINDDSPLQKAITETEALTLSYKDYVFSFEFAALHYSAPEKNQYAYMMEGFDRDWNMIGPRRVATYTNLPAGEYIFRVKGTNSDGLWNTEGISVKMTVTPPWWESGWFRGMMALVILGLVIGGYRWRVTAIQSHARRLEEQVAERTQELAIAKDKALEAQRAAETAQRASEVANQAKSMFISRMSHELRTPLNVILGYTQIFRRDQTLSAKQHDAIGTVHRSGEHLLAMINDLLDISRIEAQKIVLEPTNVDFPDFLKHIEEMTRIQAEQKGLAFTAEVPAEIPNDVYIDGQRLRQILLNLLNNAIKFTEQGNVKLTIEYCRLNIEEQRETSSQSSIVNLQFSIKDTGIGIPQDKMESIFQPFEQLRNTQNKTEGTGLGLAISQTLVRMMGSELHVESVIGQGTTFWFDLEMPEPPEKIEDTAKQLRRIIGYRGKPRTILLADDKAENRMVLLEMLTPLGFDVIEAVDGYDALDKAQNCHPDLLLIDLVMPMLDGFEVIRRIRQLPEFRDVIIIGISASVFEETQRANADAGADDFLGKPVHLDDLLTKLQVHLHLEWEYETSGEPREPETPMGTEAIIPPPQAELTQLYQWAKIGDMMNLQERLEELSASDPALTPFKTRISQLANNAQLDEIEQLIKQYLMRKT